MLFNLQCIWLKDCSCTQLLMYVTCPCRDCRAWRMIAFNWVPSREKSGTCSNDLKSDKCTGKGSKLIATWNPGDTHGMKDEYWSTLTEILLDSSATAPTSPLPTNFHNWAWGLAFTCSCKEKCACAQLSGLSFGGQRLFQTRVSVRHLFFAAFVLVSALSVSLSTGKKVSRW